MKITSDRPCPFCKARDVTKVTDLRPNDGHVYHIVRCDACNFVFTSNPITKTYARGANKRLLSHRDPALRHKRMAGLIKALPLEGSSPKILEIGAGHGLLGELLEERCRLHWI